MCAFWTARFHYSGHQISGAFVLLVVDSQVPLRVFRIAGRIDELIFFLGGRLVFAPRVSFVHYNPSLGDEFFGVLE
jgi:hypothetical protein